MTVCVAARISNGAVIVAADRMLSTGTDSYEPSAPKIWRVTNSIVAMQSADDVTIQAEIYNRVWAKAKSRIQADAKTWVRVLEIAEAWRLEYSEFRRGEAQAIVLEPQGLTWDSYLAEQKKLSPILLRSIAQQLREFEFRFPGVDTIIAGWDSDGSHIYQVTNAQKPRYHNSIGYVCVGNGSPHAISQFMRSGWGPLTAPLGEGFFTVYTAKRRADEVAPGVGRTTDLFVLAGLGQIIEVPAAAINEVRKIYDGMVRAERGAGKRATAKTEQWLLNLAKKQPIQPEQVTPPAPSGPAATPPPAPDS